MLASIGTPLLSPIALADPPNGTPLNCTDVYFVDPGIFVNPNVTGGLYKIDTSTAVDTLVGAFPNSSVPVTATGGGNYNRASGIVAIIGGTTPTATPTAYVSNDTYAFPGANLQFYSVNGNGDIPTATLTKNANGLAASPDGSLQYITNTIYAGGGTQQIYKFSNTNSASTFVSNITPPPGDTIFNTLTAGDNAFDSNGRQYYFASPYGSGSTGYLYYIDPNYQAHLLGSLPTPGGATGLAFDSLGNLYTSSKGELDKISLTNGFTATVVGTPIHTIVDLASCAAPTVNPQFSFVDGIKKQVRNVTTDTPLGTQNKGKKGDTLEYQILINNTGNLPSDNTRLIDSIPPGTSYVPNSTSICNKLGTSCTTAPDLTTGSIAPFTASSSATPPVIIGMEVNSPGAPPGIVNAGVAGELIVKFQVKVTAATGTIVNTGKLTYPVANSGVFTTSSVDSNQVQTTLPVAISGKVWNDVDGSGSGGFNLITTPPGEVGTNANNALYAVLVDGSSPAKVIGSTAVLADGTYSFADIDRNQTGLTIRLSATPGTVNSTTIPPLGLPTGWRGTTAKITPAFDVAIADIFNQDFGIVQPTNVILVKRITAIKPTGTSTWVRSTNPNDATPLNTVVHNPIDLANNDTNPNWPSSTYLVGAYNAGKINPGDELEYTIYYLNTQGANAKTLKICDPIRGRQTYTNSSMQLLLGNGSTPISLTDAVDAVDRANSYLPGAAPNDCNLGNIDASLKAVRDNGGVSIQLVGTGATIQPDLPLIPGAITPGTPTTAYGWFRFTTKVDP
jgi:uncharacterized repeat protein (TIGR01451 family)